ncbi:MAG: hypothetical protein ACREEE_10845, partial [Dongiaceae bacterium]
SIRCRGGRKPDAIMPEGAHDLVKPDLDRNRKSKRHADTSGTISPLKQQPTDIGNRSADG